MKNLTKSVLAAGSLILVSLTAASAATISAMGVVSNEEIDTYHFNVDSVSGVWINVVETYAGDPPTPAGYEGFRYDFDSYIWLRRSDGSLVERDDDGGSGLESRIVRVLTAGSYYLQIGTHAGHHGHTDYSMTISGRHVSEVPIPAALPLMASGFGLVGFLGWRRRRNS